MNTHKGARLTPYSRALLVERIERHGLRVEEAAKAAGVSVRTACKRLHRFRSEGRNGLQTRSSRPQRCPHATPRRTIDQLQQLRRNRRTYRQIALETGLGMSTVARLLKRAGLNRLAALEPALPIRRYEHQAPGDLLHLDIKQLALAAWLHFWQQLKMGGLPLPLVAKVALRPFSVHRVHKCRVEGSTARADHACAVQFICDPIEA